jgi:hypothetical protein
MVLLTKCDLSTAKASTSSEGVSLKRREAFEIFLNIMGMSVRRTQEDLSTSGFTGGTNERGSIHPSFDVRAGA